MKPSVAGILFALLLGLCCVLGLALMADIPEGAAGVAHPDHPSMLRGGDGSRHEDTLWLGWTLGALEILFFVALLGFGTRRAKRFPLEERTLVIGGLVYLGFFTWMVTSYATYAGAGPPPIVLGFPVPTALMLYGVGFAPVVFIVLYLLRFDPWILSDEELETFRAEVSEALRTRELKGK